MATSSLAPSEDRHNAPRVHEALDHSSTGHHHGHFHDERSIHAGGHHLLQVEDLYLSFRMYEKCASFLGAQQRPVEVLHGLNLAVHRGEIVAVVGASGSGKSLLADTVMGLFEPNAEVRGRMWFDGNPVDAQELARLRGHGISLVPQSVASLDPLMKVGMQVEGFNRPRSERRARREKRQELFRRYGLDERVASMYPHQLSGGMARRVLLCCALMDEPELIVADEPTPGLDLPLAQQAMEDFREFANQGGGVMLITHDIELALLVADRIAVFHEGTIVEETSVKAFASPDSLRHPFSRALWHALPDHDFEAHAAWVGDDYAESGGEEEIADISQLPRGKGESVCS